MNSDFLGNYSRGYVWSANQLGHAAAGLAAAFAYIWILDVLLRGLRATDAAHFMLRPPAEAGGGGDASAPRRGFEAASAAFREAFREDPALILVSYGLLALLVVLIFWALARVALRPGLLTELHAERANRTAADDGRAPDPSTHLLDAGPARRGRERAWKNALAISLILLAGGAFVGSALLLGVGIRGVYVWRSEVVATAIATLAFAAAAALMSRSPLHTSIAWIALIAAGVLWAQNRTRGAASPIALETMLAAAIAILVLLLALLNLRAWRAARLETRVAPAPSLQFSGLAIGLILGVYWLTTLDLPEQRFWADVETGVDNAAAAMIASLALWWSKEFGTDVRMAELELDLAHERRLRNGHAARLRARSGEDLDNLADLRPMQRACVDDMMADTRTDAIFYLIGAVIASAIIASPGAFTDSLWRSVFATVAASSFILVYMLIGWRWMRRAACLDRIDVVAATRFAMVESAISVRFLDGERSMSEALDAITRERGPFARLDAFARGTLEARSQSGDSHRVRHLIICGEVGSGRSALGHALACEATLDCTPPPFLAGRGRRRLRSIRRARFQTMREVYEQSAFAARVVDRQEELRGRDGVDAERAADLIHRIGRRDMFVIDEASLAVPETLLAYLYSIGRAPSVHARLDDAFADVRSGEQVRAITRILDLLYVDIGDDRGGVEDLTVWIIPARLEAPAACGQGPSWDPDIPSEAVSFARDLRHAMAWADAMRRDGSDIVAEPAATRARDRIIGVAIVGRAATGDRPPTYLEAARAADRSGRGGGR